MSEHYETLYHVIPNTVPIWLSMFSICIKDPLALEHNKMSLIHSVADVMWEQMMISQALVSHYSETGSLLYWV